LPKEGHPHITFPVDSDKLYKQITYVTAENEYSIRSMFIELANSRFRNVTAAVKLLVGVKDVSYIQPKHKH